MNNTRLDQLSRLASKDVIELIADSEGEILKDYSQVVQESQDDGKETAPKLKLSFSIEFDTEKNKLESKLSWSVKRTRSAEHDLGDPSQPELEGME